MQVRGSSCGGLAAVSCFSRSRRSCCAWLRAVVRSGDQKSGVRVAWVRCSSGLNSDSGSAGGDGRSRTYSALSCCKRSIAASSALTASCLMAPSSCFLSWSQSIRVLPLNKIIISREATYTKDMSRVEQLSRYLELLNRDPLLAPVKGVFAAQEIKPQARVLATDRGIDCVTVDYAVLKGTDDPSQRLF